MKLTSTDLSEIAKKLDQIKAIGVQIDSFNYASVRVLLEREDSQTDGLQYYVTGFEAKPQGRPIRDNPQA